MLGLDREDPPGSGDAFELVLSSIGKGLIGADDEVPDGAADQHVARPGEAADARTDVNREAADVVIREQLELAGVQAGANVAGRARDSRHGWRSRC